MTIVRTAIHSPVATAVGVLLLALFGSVALLNIPVQLTPTVEEPQITVSTFWPGASPYEVERDLIDEQEEQLKSIPGLVKMDSESGESQGVITLVFQVGTDLDTALLRVSNRLEQVPQYPEDAEKPVIRAGDLRENAIAWFMLLPSEEKPFEGEIYTLYDFLDDYVKPEFERVPGVGTSNIFGGRETELQVIVDPAKLAARQITFPQLAAALERENRNYSGGSFDEGKRRYRIRTVGEYTTPEQIDDVVITVRNGAPVYVRDVGHAEIGYRKPQARPYYFGQPSIAVNVTKEAGANVLEVMEGVKEKLAYLNSEVLAQRGLTLYQAYDETDYIYSAIDLVLQNFYVGGALAIFVLLLFLRSFSSTLIVAVAIPVSVVGTFLMMQAFDRTLNVISLAGLAFAVGMVVDNSIVSLENIYRHRQMGKSRAQAAYDGAREVWGAILASTLTTIAVFLPIVFIEQEAGQLFKDIAIAISCAVGLSLIIAITVIPSLSGKIIGRVRGESSRHSARNLFGLAGAAGRFSDGVAGFVYRVSGSVLLRLAVVVVLTGASVAAALWLMPKTEYLPQGNRNLIFGIILPPPGYNIDEVSAFRNVFRERLAPLWTTPQGESADLAGGGVDQFFFIALPNQSFMGVRSRDPLRVRELIPAFQEVTSTFPGSISFFQQSSLFQSARDAGRSIDVELTGPSLERLIGLGGEVFGRVLQSMPAAQARPLPSLDLGDPEVRVYPNRRRAAELGISNRDLGFTVNALIDGAKASDYQYQGREIDLMVTAPISDKQRTHLIEQMPIATPAGDLVTVGSVAEVELDTGPAQVNHSERRRAITIRIIPPETTPLEQAMETVQADILGPMRAAGRFTGGYRADLTGTADKLTEMIETLKWNLLLALVITYLLMAALFESFLYPFVIMFSVPLAAAGGLLGLWLLNQFLFQPLDILTMLGFIILIGTVVNNAILIVHQSLNHMREEGMPQREAIRESVRTRIRPIFMSVATSVFGMLPLVLFPGAGSELYRGLGSVVVGGLVVSTIFTLFLVPALFSLLLEARDLLAQGWRSLTGKEPEPAPGD